MADRLYSLLDFDGKINVYTTCPQSKDFTTTEYLAAVKRVAEWSDGCAGMLIYSDNSIVDPWLVAAHVIQNTKELRPLVAVQPLYMHPYSVAKMVASLGYMYHRSVSLNMIAGGFNNDLDVLGDKATHDERYQRLTEYSKIIRGLLGIQRLPGEKLIYNGEYYYINGGLIPPLPQHLYPDFLMSGSSAAGHEAAIATGATAIEYPQPPNKTPPNDWPPGYPRGIRIGIIAAMFDDDAWKIAENRFPPNRRGQIARGMATKISDSSWHKQLASDELKFDRSSPYSLWPFKNGYTSCPYLIGSYDIVAKEITRYLRLGYTTFILDIPQDIMDIRAASFVFHQAIADMEKESTDAV